MVDAHLKNLRIFEAICGKNAFHSVMLTTTMWDEVDKETGESRESVLKSRYWRSMLERNSTTSRFLRTRESAFNIIDPFIDSTNRRSSVLLQDELVDMCKSLSATAAGKELFSSMGQLVSHREDLLRRIRHEMRHSDGDKMVLEPLQEEHQRLQKSLEATVIEMRRLRPTDKSFSVKLESLKSLISKRLSKPAVLNNESPIDFYVSVSHLDGLPSGTISMDPIDSTHHSPPGSTSSFHTPLPIANVSNILPLGQGPTSGKVRTNRSKPLADATGQNRTDTILQGTILALKVTQQIAGHTPVPWLPGLVGVVLNLLEVVKVSYCATSTSCV